MFDAAEQYANDLRFFLMVMAGAAVLSVIAQAVIAAGVIFFLSKLVEVQTKAGRHLVWQAQRDFRPTPQNPYPPKGWDQI